MPSAVVVGDLMTDVVVQLREEVAAESDTASRITVTPGGSASNVAVFLSRGGIATTLIGMIGDDDRGRSLVAALENEDVVAHVRVAENESTGTVVSVVGFDGRRSMLTDRGANRFLVPGSIPAELFAARRHFHLSGYEIIDDDTRRAAADLFDRAGTAGMNRSVDCSSAAPLRRLGAQTFFAATAGAEVLFANTDEADVLTGSTEPEAIAAELRRHYPMSLVTLGSHGVLLVEAEEKALIVPPRLTRIVDTTGAGDAFTGAFLAAWMRGLPAREAIDVGLDAAATIVAIPGARVSG